MSTTPNIRMMEAKDLPFADSLRSLAGWNQTPADWERFLACAPGGCFVAEDQGVLAGTATTIRYGPELGWIGMLLVHPEHRRQGIGSALLEHSLRYLESCGTAGIRLDATPQGQPVYERFGFRPEQCLVRWELPQAPSTMPSLAPPPELCTRADLEAIVELDRSAFGVARPGLLSELLSRGMAGVIYRRGSLEGAGFGLLRDGSRAAYLGPVVAETPAAGSRIIQTLLVHAEGRPVYWDVPDTNGAATALAKSLGFRQQRPLRRMLWGNQPPLGQWDRFYAIADPAVG